MRFSQADSTSSHAGTPWCCQPEKISETDRYILPNGEDMSKFWDIVQIEKAEGTRSG